MSGCEIQAGPPPGRIRWIRRARRAVRRILEVAGDAQMRKQPGILEDVSDAALLGRYIDAPLRVEKHAVVERHAPAVGGAGVRR